jgi:broad specificity phosphatase PhoE
MDIYLLRHGLSTSNELRLVCGAADYPLSEAGKIQAQKVCTYLSTISFTKIYSSPLSRALQTIDQLRTSIKVCVETELIELDTGEVSNITVDELWKREPRYRYQGLNPHLRYPGGECLNDMLIRLRDWYQRRSQEWSFDDVILISGHEGTVCGILHQLLNIDVSNYPTFNIENCDYVRISINLDGQIRYRFFQFR